MIMDYAIWAESLVMFVYYCVLFIIKIKIFKIIIEELLCLCAAVYILNDCDFTQIKLIPWWL